MNKIPLPSSQDKWIAAGMWLVSLILLIFGSSAIVISMNYVQSFTFFFRFTELTLPTVYLIAAAAPILLIVFFIFRAWGLFFQFTQRLFLAMGDAVEGRETGLVFYSFLIFHHREREGALEIPPPAENATGSIISSLIWMIGLSYLMAVIEVAILSSAWYFM